MKLKDLAAHLGLATATVSRALAGHSDISVTTRARVKAAAEKYGYTPTATALQLRTGKSRAIGIVLPAGPNPLGDPFYNELVSGMAERAAVDGLDVVLTVPPAGRDELGAYKRLVSSCRVDGVIVARTLVEDERVDYLLQENFPFVTFGRTAQLKHHAWLDIDGHYATLLAVRRLAMFGHKTIAYIGAPKLYVYAGHRLAGYRAGLNEAHLEANPRLEWRGDLTAETTETLTNELLRGQPQPTAIICATDGMAIGALKAIRSFGLTPGRDVSVIGYGDLPFAAHTEPPLSTVSRPIRECGRRVIELLLDRIKGASTSELQELWKPALVARQSDGPAPDRPTSSE
jgi:LacI family transcriptional regulator